MNVACLSLTVIAVLSAGCAHIPERQTPADAAAFRAELLNAEDVAQQLSLYSATHDHACWDQVRATNLKLNVAARNYFLLTEYDHPTTQATSLILGRASMRDAIAAAKACERAFDGQQPNN